MGGGGGGGGEALKPLFSRKGELCACRLCSGVLWGSPVVILPQGREEVLDLMHKPHPDIVKTKNIARRYVWWLRMDARLEGKVKVVKCAKATKRPHLVPHCIPGNGRAVLDY